MDRFKAHRLRVALLSFAAALMASLVPPLPNALPAGDIAKITLIQGRGGRIDWSADGALIAFDRVDRGGRYAVFTMRPDGSDVKPVTGRFPAFEGRDAGQPAWHPSGRFLVFQAEKEDHPAVRFRFLTSPGAGHFNDLWIWDSRRDAARLLHRVPKGRDHGTLHAHFSPDGTRLSWSQMHRRANVLEKGVEFGLWKLCTADFTVDGDNRPHLKNILFHEPLGAAFYENHGFSPDGKLLVFTCNARRKGESAYTAQDIFTWNPTSGEVVRLTDSAYNEHALFSPDGSRIVWMSTAGDGKRGVSAEKSGTDYWVMKPDGSEKHRVTYFNARGHPHAVGRLVIAADLSWRPDGRAFAAYYKTGIIETSGDIEERIVLVEPGW